MRISCPDCAASYEVPDAMLSAGREVRCARCGRSWTPAGASLPPPTAAPAPRPAPVAPPEPAAGPAPMPEPVPPPAAALAPVAAPPPAATAASPPRGDERRLALAWSGSLALLALGLSGLMVFRVEVAALWLPAVRLFRAIGLS